MAVTRINNNQITDASAGNIYLGINANTKLQNYSITSSKIANNLTYGSDLTVAGNLTVQGSSTAIDTTITTIEDPVIVLASTQTGTPAVDIGFLGERGDEDNIAFVWNESADEFVTVFTSTAETNTTITISSYANFHTNDANIGGNIVINGTTSLVSNVIGAANFTGNVTGGNLLTPGLISATGNVTGGNLVADGAVIGNIQISGNINVENVIATGFISGVGNVIGGNLITTGSTDTGTLQTTGNALIGGNLIVNGNISYINIDDLRVEDPIIILGTGPNGAPLTVDDGLDRGIYMEYYTTGLGNAFVGWDNSTGNMFIANDVYFTANDVVGVNAYGTLEVGNIYSQSVVSTGNVEGGNLTTAGQVVATGNVNGGNIVTSNIVTGANVIGTSSVTGGNIVISGDDITDTNGRVNFNTAGDDVDFAVNGDTVANVFYIDAATGTASFGSETQTTNAIVAFNSTNSILAPVGNTAQRPATGVTGMIRFNTTNNAVEVYDNSQWVSVGVPVFTVIDDEQFNGDGSTVAFTLGSTQTTNSCIVSINGVVQIPTIAYSVSGTDPTCVLTFTEAPETGDIIDVRQITTTTTVTSIANSSGNAVVSVSPTTNNVLITGDLLPTGNLTQNLGSPSNQWGELYISGNSIYIGDVILKASSGNLQVRNFDDTADAGVEGTFISTSTTSGNLQIGFNHIEATNLNGNIELRPNGTGVILANSAIQLNAGIINGQANGVGNIGSTSTYFNTVFAKATSAQYADLAEKYVADAEYAPGTVVEFGGSNEVTVCNSDACTRVAGVVSTNPSYIMNAGLDDEHVATVALTGRVPTMVVGPVRKGDMMVSADLGRARAEADPKVGTVIGKALEDFEGGEGTIEVVVGRF